MSTVIERAQEELNYIDMLYQNDHVLEGLQQPIMDLLKAFGESKPTGAYADYAIPAIVDSIHRLFLCKPIAPLTGEDDEWEDISEEMGFPCWQNRRYSSIFKNKDGVVHHHDAIHYTEDGENWFTSNAEGRNSTITIEKFPYRVPLHPQRVYLDAVDEVTKCECEGCNCGETVQSE